MVDTPERERRTLGLPRIEVGGRWFTKYDPNIALDIVERIADGELLSKITAKDAEPLTITKSTFLRWVATVPELSTAYSAAIQISAQAFEEKAIDKAERTANAPGSPQNVSAASLLISQYRWSAARRNPTKYSDKGNTQIVVPININTTLDLGGQSSQQREAEVPDIYTISLPGKVEDVEFSEVKDEPEAEEKEIISKEDFKAIIRPEIPIVGTQSQPIIARKGKATGNPGVPRKQVLTPRTPKESK